jgi:hypothetical protein
MQGAGGTPGGFPAFLIGLVMTSAGGCLITKTLQISIGSWFGFFGGNTFGLTLIPLIFGIGFLFFDGSSKAGWVLTIIGTVFIFAGILLSLRLTWARTSLFDLLVMIVLFVGGLGLMARSLKGPAQATG